MQIYLRLIDNVLNVGKWQPNRTGTPALTIPSAIFQHELSQGFPLLTTKKMAFKSICIELEFFIKGITDKNWLKDRGCHIWDEWCRPSKIPKGLNDVERKEWQLNEPDLGAIYGAQWRSFGKASAGRGVDQLKNVIAALKKNPQDRRLLVSAWNPLEIFDMALPPCHVLFHLVPIGDVLNLSWFQRSCDLMLGVPFNIASYALLLHLLCLETKMKPGQITGMFSNVHIYENHVEGARLQLKREPLPLPQIKIMPFFSIFDWEYQHAQVENYRSHEKIPLQVAI